MSINLINAIKKEIASSRTKITARKILAELKLEEKELVQSRMSQICCWEKPQAET